jgi:hypothetical protein
VVAVSGVPAAVNTATTSRVNVSSSGEQANGFTFGPVPSGDGRYAVFGSEASNLVPDDTNGIIDAFVRGPVFERGEPDPRLARGRGSGVGRC